MQRFKPTGQIALKAAEQDHPALFVRQVGECPFEISQLQVWG